MSVSPYAKAFRGRANAPSSSPISRRKWCSPVPRSSSRLCSIIASTGSQFGSFGKASPYLRIPGDVLAAQLGVVHLALRRTRAQRLFPVGPLGLGFGACLVLFERVHDRFQRIRRYIRTRNVIAGRGDRKRLLSTPRPP